METASKSCAWKNYIYFETPEYYICIYRVNDLQDMIHYHSFECIIFTNNTFSNHERAANYGSIRGLEKLARDIEEALCSITVLNIRLKTSHVTGHSTTFFQNNVQAERNENIKASQIHGRPDSSHKRPIMPKAFRGNDVIIGEYQALQKSITTVTDFGATAYPWHAIRLILRHEDTRLNAMISYLFLRQYFGNDLLIKKSTHAVVVIPPAHIPLG